MTIPAQILLVLIGLAVSAQTRLNATVLGQHFSIPVLGLVFAALVLILVVVVLVLARSLAREIRQPRRRPRWAHA